MDGYCPSPKQYPRSAKLVVGPDSSNQLQPAVTKNPPTNELYLEMSFAPTFDIRSAAGRKKATGHAWTTKVKVSDEWQTFGIAQKKSTRRWSHAAGQNLFIWFVARLERCRRLCLSGIQVRHLLVAGLPISLGQTVIQGR